MSARAPDRWRFGRWVMLVAVLLPLGGLAQGAKAQDSPTTMTETSIPTDATPSQDVLIARKLRAVLAELGGYDDVTVRVREGIVTLEGRTLDGAIRSRLDQIALRVEGVIAVENRVTETTDLAERLVPALDRVQGRITSWLPYLPLLTVALLGGLAVGTLGFWIASWRQPWDRISANEFIADVVRQMIRIAAVMAAVVVTLDFLGATALLGTFLGAAGILGLAVGFAVRDSVENFIASLMLSLRSPFRPKDLIEINGDLGRVIRLTSRSTLLISPDGNHIRIPNATVFKSRIINYSRLPERRFSFSLSVASTCDLAAVRTLMLDRLQLAPFVLNSPGPGVWLDKISEGTASYTCAGWVNPALADFTLARGEALRLIQLALDQAGFARPPDSNQVVLMPIPDPQPAKRPAPAVVKAVPDTAARQVATVSDHAQDDALDRIVDEELAQDDGTNLLDHKVKDE